MSSKFPITVRYNWFLREKSIRSIHVIFLKICFFLSLGFFLVPNISKHALQIHSFGFLAIFLEHQHDVPSFHQVRKLKNKNRFMFNNIKYPHVINMTFKMIKILSERFIHVREEVFILSVQTVLLSCSYFVNSL